MRSVRSRLPSRLARARDQEAGRRVEVDAVGASISIGPPEAANALGGMP